MKAISSSSDKQQAVMAPGPALEEPKAPKIAQQSATGIGSRVRLPSH
jgi:hypothetical protein